MLHREIVGRHSEHWRDYARSVPSLLSFGLFLISIFVVQPYAIEFTNNVATTPVGDIILSNTPVFNVGLFFVYGMFALIIVITLLCLAHPKRIAFTLYALTLFVLIRSVFVTLTHVGPFITQAVNTFGPGITLQFFGADHFFSGHAGAPFLMALMYWHHKTLRYIFLLWSAFFSVIVLLGHLHYTIDVLAAYFITYGIYHIALWLFPSDRALFLSKN